MRRMSGWAAIVVFATAVAAAQQPPAAGYAPGARVLLDAHNAYPTEGGFADRIDRALATGLPLAIEQDLFWFNDPRSGVGRSVVAHVPEEAAMAPTFEDYFFAKVAPDHGEGAARTTPRRLAAHHAEPRLQEQRARAPRRRLGAARQVRSAGSRRPSAPRRRMLRRRCRSDRCSC